MVGWWGERAGWAKAGKEGKRSVNIPLREIAMNGGVRSRRDGCATKCCPRASVGGEVVYGKIIGTSATKKSGSA